MTTNRVRSFDRSGSAPVSDPEESPTRREGALPRRVVRSFPGLNNSRDSTDWKKAFDCTSVRMYESTTGRRFLRHSTFSIRYSILSRFAVMADG